MIVRDGAVRKREVVGKAQRASAEARRLESQEAPPPVTLPRVRFLERGAKREASK